MKPWLRCAIAAIGMAWVSPASAQAFDPGPGSSIVILVRHGEKACTPPDDPPLSEAGARRAQALADVLRDAQVDVVITTEFRRTIGTAKPLVRHLGIEPVTIMAGKNPDHVKQVVDAIDAHPGRMVLVVGHTNTIPAIIARLGGPTIEEISEQSYSNLYIVHRHKTARLIRSRYGEMDDAAHHGCG